MPRHRKTSIFLAVPTFVIAMGSATIVFGETGGEYVDDTAITTKIKAAMIADQQLKATQVSVETDQGVVKLSGTVDTEKEEAEALRVANQVNGVKSVKDLLNVRETQSD